MLGYAYAAVFTLVFYTNTTSHTAFVVWKLVSRKSYFSLRGRRKREIGWDKNTFRVSVGTFKVELKILFESLSCAEIRFCLFKFPVSLSLLIGCSLEFLYLACLLLKGQAPMQQVSLFVSKISRSLELPRFVLEYEYISSWPSLHVEIQTQVLHNPLVVIHLGTKEINL